MTSRQMPKQLGWLTTLRQAFCCRWPAAMDWSLTTRTCYILLYSIQYTYCFGFVFQYVHSTVFFTDQPMDGGCSFHFLSLSCNPVFAEESVEKAAEDDDSDSSGSGKSSDSSSSGSGTSKSSGVGIQSDDDEREEDNRLSAYWILWVGLACCLLLFLSYLTWVTSYLHN